MSIIIYSLPRPEAHGTDSRQTMFMSVYSCSRNFRFCFDRRPGEQQHRLLPFNAVTMRRGVDADLKLRLGIEALSPELFSTEPLAHHVCNYVGEFLSVLPKIHIKMAFKAYREY